MKVIIDGSYLYIANRAKLSNLSITDENSERTVTGGFHGFLMSLNCIIEKYNIGRENFIICFDGGGYNYRKDILPTYKENRKCKICNDNSCLKCIEKQKSKEEMDILYNILPYFGFNVIKPDFCEADDIIINLAIHEFKDEPKLILSNDKDIYQIFEYVYNAVIISNANNSELHYDCSKFEIENKHLKLWLALQGDKADNIEGIKGVGPKKAKKLIEENNPAILNSDLVIKNLKLITYLKIDTRFILDKILYSSNYVRKINNYEDYFEAIEFCDKYRLKTVKTKFFIC